MRPLDISDLYRQLPEEEREHIDRLIKSGGGKFNSLSTFTVYHCLKMRLAFVDQKELWSYYDELIADVSEEELKNEKIMDTKVFQKIAAKYNNQYLALYVRFVSGKSDEAIKIYDQIDAKINDWIFEGPQYKRVLDVLFDPKSGGDKAGVSARLKSFAPQMMPFVIHEKPNPKANILANLAERKELDVPFNFCSWESDNQGLVSFIPESTVVVSHMVCLLSLELAPKDVRLYGLWVDVNPDYGISEHLREEEGFDSPGARGERKCLSRMLDFLETAPLGHSKNNEMFRFRSGGGKTAFKIKEVIHIGKTNKPNDFGGYGISWNLSHRTDVRGHWRTLPGDGRLGKDRAGEYVIPGFTWIRPYIKGDESLPYVKKVRHIRESEEVSNGVQT